jgi:peptidoglycan/xylan/chitin deacetylase (PgdA/CDA1 family)
MRPAGPGVSILTWHSISEGPGPTRIAPTAFREQLAVLADTGCAVLRLRDLPSRLADPAALPPRAVVLTFDDGFLDFAATAAPALEARGWPSTLFLAAARVGRISEWPGMPPRQVQPLLDWTALARLADQGVEIGAHGLSHLDLTRLPAAAAEAEIAGSRQVLEERLGTRVHAFAYPFGRSTSALRDAVGRHYALGVGTALRRARPGCDLRALPRIDMWYFRRPERLRRFVERGRSAYAGVRRILRVAGQAVRR